MPLTPVVLTPPSQGTFPVWALYTLTIIENPSIVAAALTGTQARNYYDYTPGESLPVGDSAVSLRPTSRYGWTYYASLPVEAGDPMLGSRDEPGAWPSRARRRGRVGACSLLCGLCPHSRLGSRMP